MPQFPSFALDGQWVLAITEWHARFDGNRDCCIGGGMT